MNNGTLPGSGVSMTKIDGARARKIREEKGLTQLYVATVVGVTTDTISRWENRRYQTIKSDNAAKLAKALEVPLETILDIGRRHEEPADSGAPGTDKTEAGGEKKNKKIASIIFVGLLLVTLTGITFFWWRSVPVIPAIKALRILPAQGTPGQPFPVVIKMETRDAGTLSLIVSEVLPPQCIPRRASPAFTTVNAGTNTVKWISKSDSATTTFFYMARIKPSAVEGETLRFSGAVTMRRNSGAMIAIAGDTTLAVSPFHWADRNRDNRIDDEEILSVYDTFSAAEQLDFDRKRIEDIWSAAGYRWDASSGKFVIVP